MNLWSREEQRYDRSMDSRVCAYMYDAASKYSERILFSDEGAKLLRAGVANEVSGAYTNIQELSRVELPYMYFEMVTYL